MRLSLTSCLATFTLAAIFAVTIRAAGPVPARHRGLFAVWANDPKLTSLPFIKGGQVVAQWADVNPQAGHYDFSPLDAQLARLEGQGLVATVQINGNRHPSYLFDRVPYVAKKLSIQVSDSAGTLAYWHPTYVDAYLQLLAAYAQHLKRSPHRTRVLGVRMNFNALGTEHSDVPPEFRDPAKWTLPRGVQAAAPWTPALAAEYQRRVVNEFIRRFTPEIQVFARNNLLGHAGADPAWADLLASGKLALFHTSSEMEPRKEGGQYLTFLRFCRSGQTLAYAEPWADAWGRHGGKTDPRWCGPEQWNYWRLLSDLNCGVSFIAIYGADLAHADNPEFLAAFDFAAKYAGFHASPSTSPGAWIALREGNILKGDYTFLLQRLPGDDLPALKQVGPPGQRFGAWARRLPKNGRARFALDARFARSLHGGTATVAVTYLDLGAGTFTTAFGGKTFVTELRNTTRWQTVQIRVPSAVLPDDAEHAHVVLTADTDLALHLIEITR